MKTIYLFFLLYFISFTASASSVLVADFGYDPDNSTAALQDAVNSEFDTLIFDLQTAPWNVAPNSFFGVENKTLIFERGVILQALPGTFAGQYDCLLRFYSGQNIEIIGHGATFRMNKEEYVALDDSEYRHALSLWNCSNVTVRGLTLRDSGGDGIYIGGENTNGQGFCEDILVENVRCLNNYRQGMSIASVKNLTVRYSEFSDTAGALPEAGVDIEPYETYQFVQNTRFEKCSFKNNGWAGIAVALFEMDGSSPPVDITFTDCYLSQNCRPENVYGKAEIFLSDDAVSPVQGSVLFERCYIDGSDYGAIYSRKTANAYGVTFRDCVFQKVSGLQVQYNEPIFFEVPDYDITSEHLGGYLFDNVLITYETDFPFLRVFGAPTLTGFKNVTGDFTVVEPNGLSPQYDEVPEFINIDFAVENSPELPAAVYATSTIGSTTITECNQEEFILQTENINAAASYSLPVKYAYAASTGMVRGDDIDLLPEGLIIATGAVERADTLTARFDNVTETQEILEISVAENDLYSYENDPTVELKIIDCATVDTDETAAITAYQLCPNPTTHTVSLTFEQNISGIVNLYDLTGKPVISKRLTDSKRIELDFANYPAGTYFLILETEGQALREKITVIR